MTGDPTAIDASTRQLARQTADLLVLCVLADGPQYGYSIMKLVGARSDGAVRLTPGTLYPLLHELERSKMVLASWETVRAETDGAGRKRKWYRLSAKGRRKLEQRAAAHRAFLRMLDAFLPSSGGQKEPA